MRLLVVAPRAPQAMGKGDQVRVAQLLPGLTRDHEVTVVHPEASEGADLSGARSLAVRVGRLRRALAALRAWSTGRPAQAGWCTPPAFARVVRGAAADHDLVLFVTVRAYTPIGDRPFVVDHIDALSENARKRSGSYRAAPLRWLWRCESRRLARWERSVVRCARAQLVTSPVDAAALPPRPAPVVIPNGVRLQSGDPVGSSDRRDIDVILTGNMAYPPNRDAAEWLAHEIAPRLGNERRVVVAGRQATTLRLPRSTEVVSDVPDLAPYLRRARVALAPLRIGTGVPNKVLEAGCAGAAVVLTPEANGGWGFSSQAVALASTPESFAAEIERLLDSEELRRERVRALRVQLERFDVDRVASTYEQALIRALT